MIPVAAPLLANYRALLAKVDALCARIVAEQRAHLACRPGCDSCCRHLSLSPVEAAALAAALCELAPAERTTVQRQAQNTTPEGSCPLLVAGCCAIYTARPVICRTHGLPLLLGEGKERRVDFCPENFQGVASLPAATLIDLEALNRLLATVNALFLRESGAADERLFIAEVVIKA